MIRRLLYLLSVGILALAVVYVPLPLLIFRPAAATSITSVIEVSGATDEVTGQLLLTTVAVGQATVVEAIDAAFDPYEDITRREQVIPSDVNEREFFETQRQVFDESVQVAAAVGLRAAGMEVTVEGDGARIVDVVPEAPAAGALRAGDVVVAAAGDEIKLASELQTITTGMEAGEELALTILRDGERQEVRIEIGQIPGTDSVGLGVLVDTLNQQIELPADTSIENVSNIGGPSAGLMLALTIYDLFDPADLTDGRAIAGTGTVSLGGQVGPIGGIEEKVRGAVLSDADVFLAPASQAEAARAVAPDDLEVIAVETVQDAIDALES